MNKSSTHSNAPAENAGDAALDMLLNPAPETAASDKTADDKAPETAEARAATAPVAAAPAMAVAPALDAPPAIAKLDAATRGLQMPSETDAPFRTVYWPLEKSEIAPSEVALYLTENADADVKTQSVSAFFKNATTVEDWMGDDEKATAKQFDDLVEMLNSQLENPRVYRIGEREITAAVIGKVKGGFAGVVTTIVET